MRKLLETGRNLRQYPYSGRQVPEFEDERIREKLAYSYRLIYRVEADIVTIAGVVHMRQSFDTGVGRLRQR